MFQADSSAGAARWPLVRVQAGGETRVILVHDRLLPLSVHWVQKSIVCPGDGCDLCTDLPVRGLFYLPVVCCNRVSLLELGAQAASHLEQHCKLLHAGLRPGLSIRLSRRTSKSPIYSEVLEFVDSTRAIDFMTFVSRVMALYHLPCANPEESFQDYSERLILIAKRRAQIEYDRMRRSISRRV